MFFSEVSQKFLIKGYVRNVERKNDDIKFFSKQIYTNEIFIKILSTFVDISILNVEFFLFKTFRELVSIIIITAES